MHVDEDSFFGFQGFFKAFKIRGSKPTNPSSFATANVIQSQQTKDVLVIYQCMELIISKTFAPIVKPMIIRLILSIVVTKNWDLKQLDMSNVFLHGLLEKTVYM